MAKEKLTEQEWETFLGLADRLEIPVRKLFHEDVRFHELESAGHALGRVVAQTTTEKLALSRAARLTGLQPCPRCKKQCPIVQEERPLETGDGPIDLSEPVCHCSACRRDFFPSASRLGAHATKLQSHRRG